MHPIITCAILGTSAAHDAATLLFHDLRVDGTPLTECGFIADNFKRSVTRGIGLYSMDRRALYKECWEWNAHIADGDRTFVVPGLIDCVPNTDDDVFASF